MTKNGLIIFARQPRPGRVKTRLADSIGDGAAAGLYRVMLLDVLNISRKLADVETTVFWDCPESDLGQMAQSYGCSSRKQAAGDLGERMRAAFEEMFYMGFSNCCIIGSDIPDLPPAYIRQAFELLEKERTGAVFGPSSDGGYYLLGLKKMLPELFSGISWSTPQVLSQSLAAAEACGTVAELLPVWHDIDTLQDLNDYYKRTGNFFTVTGTV